MTAQSRVEQLVHSAAVAHRREESARLLRAALLASGALGVVTALLVVPPLALWPTDPARAVLFTSLPLLALLGPALTRRRDQARAALRLDQALGARSLLLTAWDLARRGRTGPAESLVLASAERAAPRWSDSCKHMRAARKTLGLLPALLGWLAVVAWLLAATPRPEASLPHGIATTPVPATRAVEQTQTPPRGLAAAIAELDTPPETPSAPVETSPPSNRADHPGADAGASALPAAQTTHAPQTPPAGADRPAGSRLQPGPRETGTPAGTTPAADALAASPGVGTRAQDAPRVGAVPPPATEGADWSRIDLVRSGRARADPDAPGRSLPAESPRVPAVSPDQPATPAIAPAPGGSVRTRLTPTERAFIQRLHAELHRSQSR